MRATSYLKELLQSFIDQRSFTWPDKAVIEPPKDKSFGDMAANLALVLAGQAKTAPRNVAGEICAFALENGQELASAEVAGPGFINFTFKPEFWQQCVPEVMAAKDAYGSSDAGKGRKIQVEYVSANPTGPLHIGHGRGAAVGDSLARILRFNGSEVETEYYVNDAGRQMRLLGLSVWVRLQQARGKKIDLPEDCYKGDYIRSIAATVMEKNPSIVDTPAEDEEDAIAFCREVAMQSILGGIKEDLEAFGVEHQVWFSEKSLLDQGAVDKTFALLKERGLGYEEDGAFWFKTTEFGDDKDRVLKKSDGFLTYFASDIAYHDNKYDRGFDLVVDIWGADHHGYIPRMKAAVQALGRAPGDLEVILVQLVNLLRGGEQIAMSTRAGQFETLSDVCEEVGADAARFMFLTRKSDSPLDFDLELVKQKTMDNPVYYVQYAHARIRSVERKAAQEGVRFPNHAPGPEILARLDTDEDMALLKLMARFPEVVNSAAEHLSPHFISYYLQELAGALHRYYAMHQVLAAPDKDTVQARLALLAAVSQVLRNGLSLLGVSAPDRM